MEIRKLKANEKPPMDLLMLADPSIDRIEEYIEEGDCFVAEDEQQIVGVYVLLQTSSGNVELMNVAVAEDLQGRGIGKKLVLDAIQVAETKGYTTLFVATGNSSIGQLALYQKCGFRIVGVDQDHFVIHYPETIFENGIQCRDRIKLEFNLKERE
ncbi:GNAT family N-acetyltransferase [Sporosarcina sp. BI001-red]|uniref:GNAT family N-acetyltransferase n=1 Tax=Sporosarcina sp. BI001-red TaxID=2282866 RepID=UPI000E28A589|nr:GNAT family N-acetyltransferase [Sporosarcina sp. BI001-red]REB07440.1 GNAT family N-acetyltransferase [Sporosarcina sp. BI001-red]